ncbi:protein SSUH2 homolog [Alosa sapidissima]|uniref:protein SSUH2 homolog n=1 Tax=Alosa sapidissima TaxID=34773 RepID=UPI001C09EE77|nr:protein SSUH2 homolog [Alosa sapidissima]
MSEDNPPSYRCDVILAPSQYTTVSPPGPAREQDRNHRTHRPSEIYHPLNLTLLSDADITDIVLAWVKTKTFLSSGPAKEFMVTSTNNDVIFFYFLETFTEHRSVCMRFEPQIKDLPQSSDTNNQEPRPWKVAVSPVKMFSNQVCHYRLINTDQHRGCQYCQEQQWVTCSRCGGVGQKPCAMCKIHQGPQSKQCSHCHGKRQVSCAACMALGRVCCRMCVGKGHLCYFKELRVEYRTHMENRLLTGCGVPEKKLLKAAGDVVHASIGTTVRPLSQFSVPEVNDVSQQMVEASHRRWPHCKVIQQRHLLKAIPVTFAQYYWKGETGGFYIYGTDNRVYWPDYPQCRLSDRCTIA